MSRGSLRVYLGAATGVGKTCAMLDEGNRRAERGTRVVVGFVETHGRARTAERIGDLRVLPRAVVDYRGSSLEEMDLDALLTHRPQVALVDDLAHTNVPGSRNAKRWQDIEELLAVGIDVVSTANVEHLESLNDVVERITGVAQHETVPDAFVRAAGQVELVDMTPEALRRRLAHGNVYPAERIDAALANYFRPGNLAALRELALLWVADRVDDALQDYLHAHGIAETWETRERVVVAITGAAGTDALIRRAARMATRSRGELVGVWVRPQHDRTREESSRLDRYVTLLEQLGGSFRETSGNDVASAVLEVARDLHATQVVLGASRRSQWTQLTRGSVITDVLRAARDIDVHVISQDPVVRGRLPRVPARLHAVIPLRRRTAAFAVALLGLPAMTAGLLAAGGGVDLSVVLLGYLVLTVGAAALGGLWPGVVAATGGVVLANYYFTDPVGTLLIDDPRIVVAVATFGLVAAVTSWLADAVARRSAEATRARAESSALARLSTSLLHSDEPLGRLVHDLRAVFGLRAATLLAKAADGWRVEAAAGTAGPTRPDDADDTIHLDEGWVLAVSGSYRPRDDQRLLAVFAAQLALAIANRELQAEAGEAAAAKRANEVRAALLSAVSHDLRTPLATIKSWVTTLLEPDVVFDAEQRTEMLATVVNEVDRMDRVVGNLLDVSRVQADAVPVRSQVIAVADVLAPVLSAHSHDDQPIVVDVGDCPAVVADPALLERVLDNLVGNAVRHAPTGTDVRLFGGAAGDDAVEVRVADRGTGFPRDQRDAVFQPFQRLGDRPRGEGLGLGLAVARGLTRAMGGDVWVEDTPGGGATLVIRVPRAAAEDGGR